jgi:hypothetical protein
LKPGDTHDPTTSPTTSPTETCWGHGTIDVNTNKCVCDNEEGNAWENREGNVCKYATCPHADDNGNLTPAGEVCGGHGVCNSDLQKCDCPADWHGIACEKRGPAPTRSPTETGVTYAPTASPTLKPTRSPLEVGSSHAPTSSPTTSEPTGSPTPAPPPPSCYDKLDDATKHKASDYCKALIVGLDVDGPYGPYESCHELVAPMGDYEQCTFTFCDPKPDEMRDVGAC